MSTITHSEDFAIVASELGNAQDEIGPLPCSGYNQFTNHAYPTLADYTTACQAACSAHGLTMISSTPNAKVLPDAADGSHGTLVSLTLLVVHGDTGQWIEVNAMGEGRDKMNNSTAQAITTARRTAMSMLFNLVQTTEEAAGGGSNVPTAAPAFSGGNNGRAPAPANFTPGGNTGTFNVSGVTIKRQGEGKNGKPYTIYNIATEQGVSFDTFNEGDAKLADGAAQTGTPVTIGWEESQWGNNLKTIEGAATPNATPEPAPATVGQDEIPF